jgi:hypothetical protein
MTPFDEYQLNMSRRELLFGGLTGMGAAALSGMLPADAAAANGFPGVPTHAAKAKNVIFLFQNGGPTHVDLFDYKPKLKELHNTPIPDSYIEGKRFSTMTKKGGKGIKLLAPVEPFRQYGESGAWVSDFMPHTGAIADDLCFIKSMHTEQVNHAPAITFMLCGGELPGRPTMGAWLNYGIGSENENLPAYVVMTSVSKGTSCGQIFYDFYWGSGFLPSRFQGVKFRGGGDPVLYLSNPKGVTRDIRRGVMDDIAQLNEMKLEHTGDPEIAARIAQYEMAFRMQTSVPELSDISAEPQHVLDMYGPQVKERGTFAHNCLMARRLVERGTRFVQVMHAGWDQHNSLTTELYNQCRDTDQPSAGLVQDLKQRGLLDDTLVIWGGEFGRTPFLQGDFKNRKRWGRDHHPYAFTTWMAGGGIKPGMSYGASDEIGMDATEDRMHVHDFQATLLHQLGIDHEKLTYMFQGRHFRLTDVHGHVVHDILA